MGRRRKLFDKIMGGRSDRNIRFDELRTLLKSLGFEERIVGSHHIFSLEGAPELLDLQTASGGKAKDYQVKQVRRFLNKYKLPE